MPLLKHAKKKLRQDKKRTLANKRVKVLYKSLIKAAKANPTLESVSQAVSAIDKAAKNKLMHPNKAARMKSALSKLELSGPKAGAVKASAKKETPKKATTKKAAPKTVKKK